MYCINITTISEKSKPYLSISTTEFSEGFSGRKNPEKNSKIGEKNIDTAKFLLYNVKELTQRFTLANSEGGEYMSQVKVKENESLDSALRRFKRQTSRDGVIQEVRKREHYEKPSVKRKKKSEAARKRKYK